MGRLFLAIAVGLVGAAIIHIAVIFAMPSLAEDSAWNRLARLAPPFVTTSVLAQGQSPFPYPDPAFAAAFCRFDTSSAPVRIDAGANPSFWTVSIFTRAGDNIYGINQRAALDDTLDLVVGSQDQLDQARIAGLFDESDAIPVPVDALEGYAVLRAAVEQPSLAPAIGAFVRGLSCAPVPIPDS